MTRNTFRNIAIAGLLGLAGLLNSGCSTTSNTKCLNTLGCAVSEDSLENATIQKKQRIAEPSSGAYYTGYVSGAYANQFLADNIMIGKGPVVQTQAYVKRKDNLIKGDSIHVGAFGNYDIRNGEINEADFNVELTKPVFFWENLMQGYDNPEYGDFVSVGYVFRQYPNGFPGTKDYYDHVVSASFLHSSSVDLKFESLYVLPDANTSEGQLFRFTGSKRVQLREILGKDFYINPFVSTAYAYNWYGLDGFTAVTSGVDVTFEKDKSVIGGRVQCQSSLNSDVKDVLYAGAEIGFKF